MDNVKYQLRYLPLFYEDMAEVVDYISIDLQNPSAAMKLIDLTEQAILKRLDNPLSFFYSLFLGSPPPMMAVWELWCVS